MSNEMDKMKLDTNPNVPDAYILGLPIETEFGVCRFVKVKEYFRLLPLISILSTDKNRVIANIYAQKEKDKANAKAYDEAIESFQGLSFYEIMKNIPQLEQSYMELTYELFQKDIWSMVDKDNFENLKETLIVMNNVTIPETSSNPEIQYYYDLDKKSDKDEGIDFTAIVTSVALSHGYTYETINEMTFFQLNMAFKRTSEFKNYDTSTLFATVAEKVDIANWYKSIPILSKEKIGISREEFDKQYGDLF